ncbi:hypothetical protein HK103_004029 [Boothiomyces macroporosus]|uniref:Uncharacterized protein n=1 Tax=Boothiomyces macroporosus TaxID=261099 RepID=A0AAD5XZP2_9FUNG|nr:hypothetical protein HK103_004029 [Boothiomyces macroporosus]
MNPDSLKLSFNAKPPDNSGYTQSNIFRFYANTNHPPNSGADRENGPRTLVSPSASQTTNRRPFVLDSTGIPGWEKEHFPEWEKEYFNLEIRPKVYCTKEDANGNLCRSKLNLDGISGTITSGGFQTRGTKCPSCKTKSKISVLVNKTTRAGESFFGLEYATISRYNSILDAAKEVFREYSESIQ